MSFLPGLGLEEPEEIQKVESSKYDLAKDTEWRFEVAFGKYTQVKVATGSAELFGTELVTGNTYIFSGTKAAIYTWHGCSLEVSGDALQSEYTAEETPMNEYINVHFALEILRDQAKAAGRGGPRVLILGPENAGKSTLAKILTGYGVRSARSPVLVNLDVKEGVMSLPGTMTATVFKTLIDVEEGWGTAPMSGPNGSIPVKLPLVYYYGASNPDQKEGKVYKAQLSRLALAIQGRLSQDPDTRTSGILIDTPGSLDASKSDLITHIVSEFSISHIIALGSERLYSDLVRRFDNQPVSSPSSTTSSLPETISVIKLTRSGGCVSRDNDTFMTSLRSAQIRTYFYGNPRLSNGVALQPRQQQVDFSSLTIWQRLGSFAPGQLSSANHTNTNNDGDDDYDPEFLPGDAAANATASGTGASTSSSVPLPPDQIYERITTVQPAMKGCVLAVLNCAPDASQSEIRDSSVMGFLFVVDVDEARGRVSLLSPVAGRVPERAVVWAGWPEGVLGMT